MKKGMYPTLVSFTIAMTCALNAWADGTQEDPVRPMGYVPGANVYKVEVEDGRIDTISGIVYSQIRSTRAVEQLRMTILTPRNTAKKPAIVYFPGGGFTTADHEKFIELRYALARAGFVVAAAEYRPVPAVFPALLEDGKAAVRWLRAHADQYGIDSEKIGVLGDSAGGYLVEMLGATNGEKNWDKGEFLSESSDIQAVVSFYGISDLLSIGEGFSDEIVAIHHSPAVTEALLVNGPAFNANPGKSVFDEEEKAKAASPITHVDGSEPPFLLMHGSADTLVSPLQSAKLFKALQEKKVDVCYDLVEGADHGGLFWFQQPVIDRVVGWFKDKLGDPKAKIGEEGGGSNL